MPQFGYVTGFSYTDFKHCHPCDAHDIKVCRFWQFNQRGQRVKDYV